MFIVLHVPILFFVGYPGPSEPEWHKLTYILCWRAIKHQSNNVSEFLQKTIRTVVICRRFAEGSVLGLFAVTVALWITRKPDFFPGWSELLGLQKLVNSITVDIYLQFVVING